MMIVPTYLLIRRDRQMDENKPFSEWVPAPGGGMMHVYYDPYLDGPGDPERDPHPDPHPDPETPPKDKLSGATSMDAERERKDREMKRRKRTGKIYHWSYYHNAENFNDAANRYAEHAVLPPFTESYAVCRYYDTNETTGDYPVYLSSNLYYLIKF